MLAEVYEPGLASPIGCEFLRDEIALTCLSLDIFVHCFNNPPTAVITRPESELMTIDTWFSAE